LSKTRNTALVAIYYRMIIRAGRKHAAFVVVLPKRLAKYGLTLHPEKTRLIDFRRLDQGVSALPGNNSDARSRPDTFGLLGFTHYWAKSQMGTGW
jgi:hypothetical protein